MALIEVNNLTKVYKNEEVETPALRGVSFVIEKGEFVALVGPSGSGKSTLMHILGFLEAGSEGSYRFAGKTMDEYGAQTISQVRNKKMGFVFQAFFLLARTSVLENVKLPLMYSDVPATEWNALAKKRIASVGLEHRLHHTPEQLSGGEKQRVAIARALVNDPDVIFADEPTGNLDSASGASVMRELQRLNKEEGRTIVLVTHETYTAAHAQRIITMHDGKVASDEKVGKRVTAERDGFRK